MRYQLHLIWLVALIAAGCQKESRVDGDSWSQPGVIAKSRDALSTSFSVYPWNDSFIAIGGENGTFALRMLEESSGSWKTISTTDAKWIPLDCDPQSPRVIVTRGLTHPDKIEIAFLVGEMTSNGILERLATNSLVVEKSAVFRTADPNISFPTSKVLLSRPFAGGMIGDSEIHIPYSFEAQTVSGRTLVTGKGPFGSGVFSSLDSGRTWKMEHISDDRVIKPSVGKTHGFWYFFAGNTMEQKLLFSRRLTTNDSWSPVARMESAQCPTGVNLYYKTTAVKDTMHLCWIDRRNERSRLNLSNPNRENYEVAYCHRKDSDAEWSKEVIISDGLLYSYHPVLSAEGDNLVIAWAGVGDGKDGHNEFSPNDIFFATSKDGGKSWSKPLNVTNRTKDGMTSGRPQVALHNGAIHLFYIQGKNTFERVGGAVKVNQPPWPIYYQQRPFLN